MPELPEVETVLRTLEDKIKDARIDGIDVLYAPIVEGDVRTFRKKLIGQHFRSFDRRGKFLIFGMDDITLVSHLRMEGKYYILGKDDPIDKHTHVIFHLHDGRQLRYHDVRKFGRMELIPKADDYSVFKELGPEPFSRGFSFKYCKEYLKGKKKPVKEVLLDQSFVAGIGNIYADEILWDIRVNPLRSAEKLSDEEIRDLIAATCKILKKAIQAGGTTIRSYTSSLGVSGRFQLSLNCHTVHTCKRCGREISKIRVGGRGTYYCPSCQKK
ncbi:MAG: DNA-formamidopyrimidine glycosylase [Erysipelotrichaceae bacterium]|nr:DNA-formamidopyrimidine glycosylase [Erysipelotrichaceae bacterium]